MEESKKKVLERDGSICRWVYPNGRAYGKPAYDVDYINRRGSDGLENLRTLCSEHHAWKSTREGFEVRIEKRERIVRKIAHEVELPHLLVELRVPSGRQDF